MASSNVLSPEVVYVPINVSQRFQVMESMLADIKLLLDGTNAPEQYDMVEAEEAAQMIHLGMNRFYNTYKKILPYVKTGKKILFSRKDIEAYLISKKETPISVDSL